LFFVLFAREFVFFCCLYFLRKLETQGASGPVDPNTPGFGYAFIEFANIEVLGENAVACEGTADVTTPHGHALLP
jgi:hypothetical protein